MKILVSGGAGYIGSAAVKLLLEKGYEVVVVDNLSKGDRRLVPENVKLYSIDTTSKELFDVFETENIDAVMHFAAYKAVGESMENAVKYSDNISGVINMLNCMVKFGVKRIIFSSTAATFGEPEYVPIDEKHPTNPVNYYGFTKLSAEGIMKWYSEVYSIDYVALRYFNVAGDCGLKYVDPDAKNIFPIIMEALTGVRSEVQVFGDDFETNDGTGVRDYVDVRDLVSAHVLALDWPKGVVNLGSGEGYSVLEVINGFNSLISSDVPYRIVGRRAGDPAKLMANNSKALSLGWKPEHDLNSMIKSTLDAYGYK